MNLNFISDYLNSYLAGLDSDYDRNLISQVEYELRYSTAEQILKTLGDMIKEANKI